MELLLKVCTWRNLALAAAAGAMLYGAVVASINVEGFSLGRFKSTSLKDVEERYERFRKMLTL